MGTLNQRTKAAPQLTYNSASGSGSYINFSGPLISPPVIIIFDNQSTVAVTISDDSTNDFKTFAIGQGLSLDLQTNSGSPADSFSWIKGTQFSAKSIAGTGNFYISYVYAT